MHLSVFCNYDLLPLFLCREKRSTQLPATLFREPPFDLNVSEEGIGGHSRSPPHHSVLSPQCAAHSERRVPDTCRTILWDRLNESGVSTCAQKHSTAAGTVYVVAHIVPLCLRILRTTTVSQVGSGVRAMRQQVVRFFCVGGSFVYMRALSQLRAGREHFVALSPVIGALKRRRHLPKDIKRLSFLHSSSAEGHQNLACPPLRRYSHDDGGHPAHDDSIRPMLHAAAPRMVEQVSPKSDRPPSTLLRRTPRHVS